MYAEKNPPLWGGLSSSCAERELPPNLKNGGKYRDDDRMAVHAFKD